MLKRYQVMLYRWQESFIRKYAQEYDFSFSEAVRTFICAGIIAINDKIIPDYQPTYGLDELVRDINLIKDGGEGLAVHDILSNLYYESRKGVEKKYGL